MPGPAVATAGRWEVEIPWRFTSLNKLLAMHWGRANRTKKAEADIIAVYCNRAGIPRATGRRLVTQRIILAKGERKMDADNIHKSVNDGLKKCGRLVDDNPKWVALTQPQYIRGTEQKTILIIQDL